MEIKDSRIDGGKAFDWGKTSQDYAKFRDIYPDEFYEKIIERGIGVKGQNMLDIGTGTGVIPRNMYKYGAKWIGTDISENQIEQAKLLSRGMDIDYYVSSAENPDFPENSATPVPLTMKLSATAAKKAVSKQKLPDLRYTASCWNVYKMVKTQSYPIV